MAREHMSTQDTSAREHVSTQDMLAREHVSETMPLLNPFNPEILWKIDLQKNKKRKT